MSSAVARASRYSYRASSTGAGNADINIEYSADLSALSRLEDKIRLLQEDLEVERELRQRIEREKADLSVQVIQMSERLEEAEGGAETQFEANRKRDVEVAKLRKLLEDVHLESEETAHLLKRKHQEVMADFQEQIDLLTKAKSRAEKEKAKFQSEVYELLSQIESLNKEKFVNVKHIEKLEVTITELHVRIEELNRTIVDITSHKTRLSQENIELVKEVQDLKINIENVQYTKSQVVSQLEDCRRRLEDEDRRRSALESSLHSTELELESCRVQLEEESEARLDLERQLVRVQGESQQWQSKYQTECAARIEEVEELRRKYNARVTELEEHIETLIVKVNNLEKQKSRLQSEVEVLIIDLEKANTTCRELQKRVDTLEKVNIDLKSRLDETIQLYEGAQRDLRNKAAEITRLNHELEKTIDANNQLSRENKKLGDDLLDARGTISELTRRLHDLEIELRRLENERDELTAAYKEAEAGRKAEEQRAQRLASDFAQFRHDAERRIAEKEEEIEAVRIELTTISMALMQMKNQQQCRRRRDRLHAAIYEDNYGYSINFYQPMIDYLDAKRYGIQAQYPHLPWTYERGLKKYRPSNLVRISTDAEISALARIAAARAERYLINAHIIIRSPFSVIKSADAARILKHIRPDNVLERLQRRRLQREQEIRDLERYELQRFLRIKRRMDECKDVEMSEDFKRAIRGKSASAISAALLAESEKNIKSAKREEAELIQTLSTRCSRAVSENRIIHKAHIELMDERLIDNLDYKVSSSLINVKRQLSNLNQKTSEFYADSSKQAAIEIEQLQARVVEAETRLKTEVARIKKKLQIQITELEMSLDVANKTNIDLQKVIKKQSLQLTELQAHYDEVQRSLQQTLDQYTVAQRRVQSLTGELEEVRINYDNTVRAKRAVELQYEEATTRISELNAFNVNLAQAKAKIEQELAVVAADYEEITKELRISDERYQKVQVELKHTIESLHEEQERVIKIETIKKSLEVEVKNLSIRLEEVELNAIAGSKRIISKLESRIRDLELELEEEKRRHAETIKILRKKERTVKEVIVQCEEDQKNIILLQESLDKANAKLSIYKRQLTEQEGMSQQSFTRVRRFQRELEAAEDRADTAETNLNLIRAKHRSFVTTSTVPGGTQAYVIEERRTVID